MTTKEKSPHMGNVKGNHLAVEILTGDEVQKLCDQCSRRAPTGVRNRALILLLFRTQLRISEALSLKPSDITRNADGSGSVNVRRGKGSKQRIASADAETLAVVGEWEAVRKARGITNHKTLFCTLEGDRMSSGYIRNLLPRLGKKAGIEKRVHAHGLRHSGASVLLEKGATLVDIQQQLGHSAPSVTDTYLHAINPKGRTGRLANLWSGE